MIELDAVRKVYPGGHVALHEVSLRVAAGTTLALLGTVRRAARRRCSSSSTACSSRAPDASSSTARTAPTLDPVALRRRIGYVVQEAGLFPHLTAADNAEVVPRLLGWPAPRRRQRVRELFALLGLDPDSSPLAIPRS